MDDRSAMTHRLAPLLAPRSIAFVGASPRPNTPGNDIIRMIENGGYTGTIYPVNPKYEAVERYRCWPSVRALPRPVELVVLSVANERLEGAVRDAIEAKARAAVIFASGYLERDAEPPLTHRIAALAREAGLLICGGNGMGFYNDSARVWIQPFATEREPVAGNITLISQSGSPFGALAHNDPRARFNLIVSAGQELTTTAADYMDYALEQPETRVIGLFLEAVRDPAGFLAALKKAADRAIPVVVLKVGRTEQSAALAISHTGAIVGNDAAFRAVCERYGVTQVDTLDELYTSLLLFAQPRRAAKGGIAAVCDSGGEREMLVDLAAQIGVPFANISTNTMSRLAARLEPGLKPGNPLDGWGAGQEFVERFTDYFTVLLEDPESAVGVFFQDLRDGAYVHAGFAEAARRAMATTDKPVVYATNFSRARNSKISLELTQHGIPVLDGTIPALKALSSMLRYRDFSARPTEAPPPVNSTVDWRARLLARMAPLDEAESLALLGDFGVEALPFRIVHTEEEAVAAAREIGFPAVLKTAEPGVLHKTERDGVKLRLQDVSAVRSAWCDLASRIGARVLVTRMAPSGVELALGMTVDPQFGPLVMVAAGGIWIETLRDAQYALAPFGRDVAIRLLNGLRARPALEGARGQPRVDFERLADTIARFSVFAHKLADEIAEIDINPLIATPDGALAVDALIIPRGAVKGL